MIDGRILFNICYMCTFFLNSIGNSRNCRYQSNANQRIFHQISIQIPEKSELIFFLTATLNPFFLRVSVIENERYPEYFSMFQPEGVLTHYNNNNLCIVFYRCNVLLQLIEQNKVMNRLQNKKYKQKIFVSVFVQYEAQEDNI